MPNGREQDKDWSSPGCWLNACGTKSAKPWQRSWRIWKAIGTSWTTPPPGGRANHEAAARWNVGMKLLEHITVELDKCGGRPCIRGLRIRVMDIFWMLAEGVSETEILKDFPYLEPDDIKVALAYAARQADHAVLQFV